MTTTFRSTLALTLSLAAVSALPAEAQRVTKDPAMAGDTAYFAVVAGADTLAREWFRREAGLLTGLLRVERPQAVTVRYTIFERADASADSAHIAATTAAGASRVVMRFRGDSVIVDAFAPGQAAPRTDRIAAPAGTLPFVNLSSGVLEQVVRRARRIGGESAAVPVLLGAVARDAAVRNLGGDSVSLNLGVELRLAMDEADRLLGGHVPVQGVRFVRLARAAWRDDSSAPPPASYAAPAGAPYTAESVSIRTPAGIRLAGTLTLPAGASAQRRAPVVVLITGSGPQNRDSELVGVQGYRPFRQIADSLGRRGVGVLRLDDRGAGESDAGPPTVTSADFADDVRAVLAWLRARSGVDAARLGLMGHSEGGLIAALVASGDTLLRGVALLSTASRPGSELSAHQRRVAVEHAPDVAPSARDSVLRVTQSSVDSAVAASPWLRYWWSFDPRPTLRRVRAPVLVLHGATDAQVPVAQGRELAAELRAAGNRDVTLREFPRLNHLLLEDPSGWWGGYAALPSKDVPAAVIGAIADWFVARLRA